MCVVECWMCVVLDCSSASVSHCQKNLTLFLQSVRLYPDLVVHVDFVNVCIELELGIRL